MMNDFKSPHQTANRGSGAGDTWSSCPAEFDGVWMNKMLRCIGALSLGMLTSPIFFISGYWLWDANRGPSGLLISAGFLAAWVAFDALTIAISRLIDIHNAYHEAISLMSAPSTPQPEEVAAKDRGALSLAATYSHNNDA